ncbi:MAG: DUF559 domain-containing protein [Marmoricola sp.]
MDDVVPFTRAEAVRAGIDPRVLRTSRFRRLFRSVYVDSRHIDQYVRIRAALALHPPDAFASHHSAARVYGLPVPAEPNEHVTVVDPQDRRQRYGLKSHAVTGTPLVARHLGMRVSHPFRMFIEMAGVLDIVNLVVLGDAMVRVFDISPEVLVMACRESDRHHARAALRGALLVREGVDSPMESRLRMLIVLAGLPEPEVNHRILDEHGRVRRRFDLSYQRIRLVVEYDGRQHAESIEQWGDDLTRREELDDGQWRILVIRAEGIYKAPADTLARIRRQLLARGWGDIPAIRDGWRPLFPVR